MDESELVAEKYIMHLGYNKPIFEPEGQSTPPDFLVDNRIAVEVRRLNQSEESSLPGQRRGLEEVAIPLWKCVERLLPSLGPPTGQVSWYIHVKFDRPVPERRLLEDAIRTTLETFRDSPVQNPTTIRLFKTFELEIFRAGRAYPQYFVMGGKSDDDAGGWVIEELERNLRICIDEKTAKVSGIRAKYSEWWLLLVDRINYGQEETIQVPPHDWDKIILINPHDHRQAFELQDLGPP
jgi:hypothetical protein